MGGRSARAPGRLFCACNPYLGTPSVSPRQPMPERPDCAPRQTGVAQTCRIDMPVKSASHISEIPDRAFAEVREQVPGARTAFLFFTGSAAGFLGSVRKQLSAELAANSARVLRAPGCHGVRDHGMWWRNDYSLISVCDGRDVGARQKTAGSAPACYPHHSSGTRSKLSFHRRFSHPNRLRTDRTNSPCGARVA
jgi:hypothetical protein